MTVATVTSKGQVTIPVGVREACGLTTGSRLDFVVASDDTILVYTRVPTLADLAGSLPNNGVHVPLDDLDGAIAEAVEAEFSLERNAR